MISAVVMTGAVTQRAHAQPSDANAVAEQLFKQARELTKANRWAEACPKLEATLRADPTLAEGKYDRGSGLAVTGRF
jgi:hypothetical protein